MNHIPSHPQKHTYTIQYNHQENDQPDYYYLLAYSKFHVTKAHHLIMPILSTINNIVNNL